MPISATFRRLFFTQLPLITAVLLDAHISFLVTGFYKGWEYLAIVLQLALLSIPFFLAHQVASSSQTKIAAFVWLVGFILYPPLLLTLSDSIVFNMQTWIFAIAASMAWFVNRSLKTQNKSRPIALISKLFSLNSAVVVLSVGWVIVMAGVFNTHDDPMHNQPLNLVIDVTNVFTNYANFLGYFWQFFVLAGIVFCVYLLNRYVLIRQVLAKQGVLAFGMAALVCIIVATPILSTIALALPIHTPTQTLLPSEDRNIFSSANYQFLFWMLAVSTPLILAFERQQQDTALARIAQQQTRSEIKLLQQQINPHFLFNTLNNLYALTLAKSNDAPQLVMQFASLLRYSVHEGQKERVTLTQEIAYLQNYIELQRIRSNHKCKLDLKWPAPHDALTVPPMLIIVLLENAFKFGVEPTAGASQIRFYMELDERRLKIRCENTLLRKSISDSGGIGLENLRRRLTLLYPDKHTFQSGPVDDMWIAEMTLELEPC